MLFAADLINRQTLIDNINKKIDATEESLRRFEKSVASFGSSYEATEKAVCSICNADRCVAESCYREMCPHYEYKLDSITDNPNSQTLIACTCKNCGGRLNIKTLVCEFCGTPYKTI